MISASTTIEQRISGHMGQPAACMIEKIEDNSDSSAVDE
jgi:hypothetical protein